MTGESIEQMSEAELIDGIICSYDLEEVERVRVQALMLVRAKKLDMFTAVSRMIKKYDKIDQKEENAHNRYVAKREAVIPLRLDDKGAPCITIDNILLIMRNDPQYEGIRYNLLLNAPEVHANGEILRWQDADEAESRHYIETVYNIHSEAKHGDALRIMFREREYHPIQDIVDGLKWDGTPRIEAFLTTWMKAEDNEYTREVSRLIFAGGINRLYSPGCKFDDVPILIGTSQGEGKSTLVRWLAMHDSYFSEVTEMDGQKSIEQLEGAWICEIAELLALTKTKEQEAVKSYITRQRDKYRKPYDRNTTEYPRRCVFIGTTNNEYFLKDKSGNRRFYPVLVKSSAYWLYDHEQECREYIIQCWAEAKVRYDRGEMPNYANPDLVEQFRSAQDDAMEDDWRVGAIEELLRQQPVGALVCVRQIKREALSASKDFPQDPTPKESQEITQLMNKFQDWKPVGRVYTRDYGRQRCWKKVGDFANVSDTDELPF